MRTNAGKHHIKKFPTETNSETPVKVVTVLLSLSASTNTHFNACSKKKVRRQGAGGEKRDGGTNEAQNRSQKKTARKFRRRRGA